MEKILLNCEDKLNLSNFENKYSNKSLGIFESYEDEPRKNKIISGVLKNLSCYQKSFQKKNLTGDMWNIPYHVLSVTLKKNNPQPPGIFYVNNRYNQFKILDNSKTGSTFHVPIEKQGVELMITNSLNELENESRKLAGEENLELERFLNYSKKFW